MPYSIRFQANPPLLRLRLSGFWDQETLSWFALEVEAALAGILRDHPRFDALADASEFAVQSAEVVEGFERIRQAWRGRNAGRTAIVLGSALARLQARRTVVDDETIAVFESEAEALAWLAGEPACAASASPGNAPG